MAKKTSGNKGTVSKAAEQTAARPAPAAEPKTEAKAETRTAKPADSKAAPVAKNQEQTSAKPAESKTNGASNSGAGASTARPPPDPRGNKALTHEQIAQRAYEIYRARGGGHGDAVADWLQAERELRSR